MPRLALQPSPRVQLVRRLARIHALVGVHQAKALEFAKVAGQVLLEVTPEERADLAQAAGITGRSTRFDYVAIATHWDAVQHAGSIRQALALIRKPKRQGPYLREDWPEIFRWFEDDVRTLYAVFRSGPDAKS